MLKQMNLHRLNSKLSNQIKESQEIEKVKRHAVIVHTYLSHMTPFLSHLALQGT
jgi:hypothetical protein